MTTTLPLHTQIICEKKTESQARTGGLSVTAGVIAQVRFVELFFL